MPSKIIYQIINVLGEKDIRIIFTTKIDEKGLEVLEMGNALFVEVKIIGSGIVLMETLELFDLENASFAEVADTK